MIRISARESFFRLAKTKQATARSPAVTNKERKNICAFFSSNTSRSPSPRFIHYTILPSKAQSFPKKRTPGKEAFGGADPGASDRRQTCMKKRKVDKKKESENKAKTIKNLLIKWNVTGRTPVPPCLSPFSLSVVDNYADENENAESCGVSLGLSQSADFVCTLTRRSRRLRFFFENGKFSSVRSCFFQKDML